MVGKDSSRYWYSNILYSLLSPRRYNGFSSFFQSAFGQVFRRWCSCFIREMEKQEEEGKSKVGGEKNGLGWPWTKLDLG